MNSVPVGRSDLVFFNVVNFVTVKTFAFLHGAIRISNLPVGTFEILKSL